MTKQYIMIVVASLLLATSGDAVAQTDAGLDKERGERAGHRRAPGRGVRGPGSRHRHIDLEARIQELRRSEAGF